MIKLSILIIMVGAILSVPISAYAYVELEILEPVTKCTDELWMETICCANRSVEFNTSDPKCPQEA